MQEDARAIATAHTLDFIAFYLRTTTARVLEVGCGAGHLARELKKLGHEVVAIDAGFADFRDDAGFDAVLFTRSLHHISPLAATVEKAKRHLRPKGLLLVEEFDRSAANDAALLFRQACLGFIDDRLPDDLPEEKQLRAAWEHEHGHHPPLHAGKEMQAALQANFSRVEEGSVPYLYRYAIERGASARATRLMLQWETRLIERGELPAIGRRWVCQP